MKKAPTVFTAGAFLRDIAKGILIGVFGSYFESISIKLGKNYAFSFSTSTALRVST